jgi:hypothetical protein
MINFIRQLVDFILLNAYSVQSVGLYNGKAGLSLCLFEVAAFLNDKEIENHAFELLQETLVLASKSENIAFENGLSGIGFVLLYLIENKLIDADFEELFKGQEDKILSQMKAISIFSEKHLNSLYFMKLLYRLQNKTEITPLTDRFLMDVEFSLEKQLEVFDTIHANNIKISVLNCFENYVKMVFLYQNHEAPVLLLNKYARLYQQGKIISRLATGYYLEKIASNNNIRNTAKMIKETAIQGIICPDMLTLSQQINLLYLLDSRNEQCMQTISLLEKGLFDFTNPEFEKNLLQKISAGCFIAGYSSGIARLLLYWVYKQNQDNNQDCFRFKYLL